MLDRLPTELLLRVLELAAPLDYSPSFYLERRHLLLDCSLVSKKICASAQAILPEVLVVKGHREVEVLQPAEGGKKRGSKVKLLILDGAYAGGALCIDIRALLALCDGLVELRLCEVGVFNLDWLSGNNNLQTLVLFGNDTSISSPPSSIFPTLIELSFCGIQQPTAVIERLSHHTFPRLRALGVALAPDSPAGPSINSEELLQRLEILNLDAMDGSPDKWCHSSGAFPSLVLDISFETSHRHLPTQPTEVPSCIRFYLSDSYNVGRIDETDGIYERIVATFADLGSLLERNPVSISSECSVILPLGMSAALEKSPELQKLNAALSKTGGEVIREDQPNFGSDSLVSPAMWRRARRVKQQKEEVANAKQV